MAVAEGKKKVEDAARIATMMFIGAFGLWVGVPIGWLWVGSVVQSVADSIGLAIAVMFVGAIVSIVLLVKMLLNMNHTYRENYFAVHGEPPERSPLEPVLVLSAFVAVSSFGFWFLIIAGPGPSLGNS